MIFESREDTSTSEAGLEVSGGELVAPVTRDRTLDGEWSRLHATQGRLGGSWPSVVDVFIDVVERFHFHESFHAPDCTHLQRS